VIIPSELLPDLYQSISFFAAFLPKTMYSLLLPSPCFNPNTHTKISLRDPPYNGFLAQDVHEAMLLDPQQERTSSVVICMLKRCCYQFSFFLDFIASEKGCVVIITDAVGW
jgi:hypothetical protein